jgi:hypothetical protein
MPPRSARPSLSSLSPARLLPLVLAPVALLLAGCGGPDLIDRIRNPNWGLCGTIIIVLDLAALVDLLGDETRETTGTVIWALLIVFFPIGGVILYFLFGRD